MYSWEAMIFAMAALLVKTEHVTLFPLEKMKMVQEHLLDEW